MATNNINFPETNPSQVMRYEDQVKLIRQLFESSDTPLHLIKSSSSASSSSSTNSDPTSSSSSGERDTFTRSYYTSKSESETRSKRSKQQDQDNGVQNEDWDEFSNSPYKRARYSPIVTHIMNSRGMCHNCGADNPENQICPRAPSTQEFEDNFIAEQSYPTSHRESGLVENENAPEGENEAEDENVLEDADDGEEIVSEEEEEHIRSNTVRKRNISPFRIISPAPLESTHISPRTLSSPNIETWYILSNGRYKILAGKAKILKTLCYIDPVSGDTSMNHVMRVAAIGGENHWLTGAINENLTVKTGVCHPSFSGYLNLTVFNRGGKPVKIGRGTPLAFLIREPFLDCRSEGQTSQNSEGCESDWGQKQ